LFRNSFSSFALTYDHFFLRIRSLKSVGVETCISAASELLFVAKPFFDQNHICIGLDVYKVVPKDGLEVFVVAFEHLLCTLGLNGPLRVAGWFELLVAVVEVLLRLPRLIQKPVEFFYCVLLPLRVFVLQAAHFLEELSQKLVDFPLDEDAGLRDPVFEGHVFLAHFLESDVRHLVVLGQLVQEDLEAAEALERAFVHVTFFGGDLEFAFVHQLDPQPGREFGAGLA